LLGYWGGNKNSAHFGQNFVNVGSTTDTNPHLFAATIPGTGSNSTFWAEGAQIASNQGGTEGPNGLFVGGGGAYSEYSDCDISEVLVYHRILNSTELDAVGTYLTTKYGLTTSYPPDTTLYDTWANGTFANPFTAKLPTDDPDGDGQTNQQEFIFGLDPTTGASVNPITQQLDKTTGVFKYTRTKDSGLIYNVYYSTNLVGWAWDEFATQTPAAAVAGVETVSVTLAAAAPLDGKLFVRVEGARTYPTGQWRSEPPADCPFEPSAAHTGVVFTGRHAEYTGADTWYPSWASDGNLYSPWTDGEVNGLGISSGGDGAATGNATIRGDDPLNLSVTDQGAFNSSPRPYEGRYPCGSLVYNGVWYYGTYCLHPSWRVILDGIPYNWPWLGPIPGFRWSTDFGKTWSETPGTPANPLFGESALNGEPLKIGAPHFVDFGKNMEHSPDGKAYLTAHGASVGPAGRRYAYNSWMTGDEIHLVRVTPSIANINDVSKYEFFAGNDASGNPQWSHDFGAIKPLAAWMDNMGCVTMTYNAPLKKYFMCVTDGGNTVHRFNTYILESDLVTGPWKLVTYLKNFGQQAYFVNIPSKFISEDGRTMWLCYSANYAVGWTEVDIQALPEGSKYAMCLQEIKLLGR
jgi:hypothetical protein